MVQMVREEMESAADNGSPIDQKILFEKNQVNQQNFWLNFCEKASHGCQTNR